MAVTGILGKKIGMTQVFDEKGDVHPITVLQAGPCVVTQLKTAARDGYDAAQIIAFGDELNDLEMLLYAGTGVAMGNARNVVKSAADFVTDTCDRDGIAKFLERHVLAQLAAHS